MWLSSSGLLGSAAAAADKDEVAAAAVVSIKAALLSEDNDAVSDGLATAAAAGATDAFGIITWITGLPAVSFSMNFTQSSAILLCAAA